jgi:hypothetical protein
MSTAEFSHKWKAEILATRPLILPRMHRVYPAEVEEVERGALEVMITPHSGEAFLATCALGFAGPSVATGVWACPDPDWLCALAGGYAYLIDTRDPDTWEQVEYRPVVEVRPLVDEGLLLFASFHTLLAYGATGKCWKTARLTSEGLRLGEVCDGRLQGWGWDMRTDREMEFFVDLKTGKHAGGVAS